MAEIPEERDFFTWTIQTFLRKVKQFVRKYHIPWWQLIDLAYKLHDVEKFLISFYAIIKLLSCFIKVTMNSKNEKHFSRRFNIQVCELLQVLTETDIKRFFEK